MKSRLRAVLVVAALACSAGVIHPVGANALVSDYYCTYKIPAVWCDGRANGSFDGLHSWDRNDAYTDGTSTTICQRIWKPSTGVTIGTSCAISTWTGDSYGNQTCACLEAEVVHYWPGGPMNIYGHADTE